MSTTITYDDRDPIIRYSVPARGHHWTEHDSGDSYGGTVKLTRTRRASASITFTGSSITVWGLLSDSGAGSDPVSSYSVDGGPPTTFAAIRTGNTQARVQFYKSDPLGNGQHTLEIVNLVEGDFLWIDSVDVTRQEVVNNPAPAPSPNPAPSPITVPRPSSDAAPSPTSAPNLVSSSARPVVTTVIRPTVIVDGSSTFTSFSTSLSTSSTFEPVVTPSVTGGVDGNINVNIAPQAEKKDAPLGAIIGGVLGGLVVLLLAVILVLLLTRRKHNKKQNLSVDPLSPPTAWFGPPGSHPSDPGHNPSPSFGSSSNLMSERSNPSSVRPFPSFVPHIQTSSPTTGAKGRVVPGASEVMGKRQLMNLPPTGGETSSSSNSYPKRDAHGHSQQSSLDTSALNSPVYTMSSLTTQGQTGTMMSAPSVMGGSNATSTAMTSVYSPPEEESPPAYRPKSTVYDEQAMQAAVGLDRKI